MAADDGSSSLQEECQQRARVLVHWEQRSKSTELRLRQTRLTGAEAFPQRPSALLFGDGEACAQQAPVAARIAMCDTPSG